MALAVEEARAGVSHMDGGPFGAVILKEGRVIAHAHNEVIKNSDPTAHAEMQAIRRAAAALGRFDLSDCEIVSTCEPCPMCLSAIYWARIRRMVYGCTREDAAALGFDDQRLYEVLEGGGAGSPATGGLPGDAASPATGDLPGDAASP
ncbi:MAG TPA: hypothetical protein DD727_04000, partial [Clostridiales bacterium]|nr:hypothetical protein [Clostridiales bacterium]